MIDGWYFSIIYYVKHGCYVSRAFERLVISFLFLFPCFTTYYHVVILVFFSLRWRRLTAQWPTRRISVSRLLWPRGTQLTSRLFSLLPCIQVMQLTFPLVKIHEQTQGVRWHKARFPLNQNLCFFGTKQEIKFFFTVWL